MLLNRRIVVPLSLMLLLAFTGCGGSRHATTERYYLVSANVKLPYWQTANAGLLRGASEMKVHAEMVGPETYDQQAERDRLRRLLSAQPKPAGILVSAADPDLLKTEIDAAIDAGIPVIAIDSDSPASKRLTFIGTNNYQAGVMAARVAVKQLNGKGNVVVFTMPNQANLAERLRGYRDVFAETSQVKIVDVIDIKGDPTIAFDTTKQILEKRRDQVQGFVCLEALAGSEVAEVLNREKVAGKVVVAFDTHEGTIEWVRKGVIAATVAQKPFTMAYFGIQVLDLIHHGQPPQFDFKVARTPFARMPASIDTGATLIDKSNVEEFLEQSKAANDTN